MNWNGGSITLKALHAGGATLGKVSKVEMLGSNIEMKFVQDENGLNLSRTESWSPYRRSPGNHSLASSCRVLRITHDKGWINDDDLEVVSHMGGSAAAIWATGDYNNDLTTSDTPGDVWRSSFTGSNVSIVAPKEPGAGKIEVKIDGEVRATVNLSSTGKRKAQQVVYKVSGLNPGKHNINIVNLGSGQVAIDAIITGEEN